MMIFFRNANFQIDAIRLHAKKKNAVKRIDHKLTTFPSHLRYINDNRSEEKAILHKSLV